MSEKSVPKRRYTNEFRVEVIGLAETIGQHEAAPRLGLPVARSSTEREGASERGPGRGRCSDSPQASWHVWPPPHRAAIASPGSHGERGARAM